MEGDENERMTKERRGEERVEGISDTGPFIISVLFRGTESYWQDERQFHSPCLLTHQVLNHGDKRRRSKGGGRDVCERERMEMQEIH